MDVSLTPELEKLVNSQVESGKYDSASEVINEALRLLQEREKSREVKLEALRREIARGTDQADRGELIPGDQVFDRLKKKNNAISREK